MITYNLNNLIKMKLILVALSLLFSCTFSIAQTSPQDISDNFFRLYKNEGVDKSLTYLFSTNKFSIDIQEGVDELKRSLKKATTEAGGFKGSDLLVKKTAGSNLIMLTYLVRYERLPFTFRILFYKPNDEWQVQNFKFNNKIDEELEDASKINYLKENWE